MRNASVVYEGSELRKRAAENTITTALATCGYYEGNATLSRTAAPGYDCRIDTQHGIWGFCPTTVIAVTDCGLAGYCIDTGSLLGWMWSLFW